MIDRLDGKTRATGLGGHALLTVAHAGAAGPHRERIIGEALASGPPARPAPQNVAAPTV